MISNIVVIRFLTVFKGNTSFYNKNELPKVKPEGGKFKTKITTVKEKLTKEEIARHLDGEIGIGLSPISNDNKVFYAVLDIDCYDVVLIKLLYRVIFYKVFKMLLLLFVVLVKKIVLVVVPEVRVLYHVDNCNQSHCQEVFFEKQY